MFNDLSRRQFLKMTVGFVAGTTIVALPSYAARPLKPYEIARKRLLLVDDDPKIILLVKDYLEFRGYEVTTAENGRKALEVLEQDLPDLIISNVLMPEMDGYTFFHNIRQNVRTRWIPFLFLSATSYRQNKIKGLNVGAFVYMQKPFELEEFVAQIEGLLKGESETKIQVLFDVYLTQTELTVVQLVARGMANRNIADELKVSQRTVESHVSNILGKTGLLNRTELARWAIEKSVTET